MHIGEAIRKARESKNYTQEYAAKKIGMSISAYGDIERGKSDPTWSRIVIIAEALGMSVGELIEILPNEL